MAARSDAGQVTARRGRRARWALSRGALGIALLAGAQIALASHADAAVGLIVTTTADIAVNAGDCGNSSTTVPSPLSLREATCIANNYGSTQAVTISVPAGHYTLSNGELQPGKETGSTVTINGAGAGSTIIDGNHASRVFDIDVDTVGSVVASISGVTITNGADSTFGGAGILDGSGNQTNTDTLTVSNSTISNNVANASAPTSTINPGGGLAMAGGSLTMTNVTVTGNSSNSSAGSGVYYQAFGTAVQSLSVTGSTFSSNSTASSGSSGLNGGALAVVAGSGLNTPYTVTNSTFTNNTSSSTSLEHAVGAAIFEQSGNLTVTGSTFTGNTISGSGAQGGPILYTAGTAALHYDRMVGNVGTGGVMTNSAVTVDATEDWWGCNTGPNTAGCESTSGTGITAAPRLQVTATAAPSHVVGPNGTATLTASLLTDSAGGAVSAANLGAFSGLPISFSDPPGDATVTLSAGTHSANISSGAASIDYHSNTTVGLDNDSVTLDNGTVTDVLEVDTAPAITSANTAHFNIGQAGSFTITTTGYPNPAISEVGTLPTGLTFHDNGDGTATISGTPSGSGGNFPLNLTANNGVAPNATQTLTLTVGQPPAFTSGATATFVIGQAGSFTVTTSGVPTISSITEAGTLPAGVTFTDNGNGTATIAGTPTGTGNTYPALLTATNGIAPNATQNLTIQVNQAPSVTLNPSDQTVQPSQSVSFTAGASGVPTPTVQWQRSTDGGASFVNIAGATSTTYTFTAAAGDNGNQYRAVFSNGVGSPATTTAATLTVGIAPAFTSADHTSFVVGQAGSFSVTTTGMPSATLSRTGAQFPAWLTLTDNGDGTGSLTGTPPAGSAGQYQFTLKAANGISTAASQVFTLFVDDSPVVTSANHATFTAGQAGSFAVTTTAGFPTTTAITETGSLPSGVTFTDNGDGTATLAGTPAAGTGGTYPLTISATASGGLSAPATQSFTLKVNAPPVTTSANHATFSAGTPGSFTVTTSPGNPPAMTLSKTGTLPAGVSFTDNGDGTATIAGTPNAGSGGVYTITITASNGVAPDATQSFTLTVNEPPHITSANHATFQLGTAGSFTVTTSGGQPSAISITETGTLPAGVSFTDNGDGTATLAGTPTAGGTFPITITASNGVLPNATQAFTLTVNQSPAITSADHTTFAVGTAGSFTVTTTPGTPAATTLTETGALPGGVTFHDNGDGTATLAGTPAAHTGGSYSLTITASNGVLPNTTQAFTLTVTDVPAFTSANHASFSVGAAGTFTVATTAGFPAATTLTEVGGLPTGVTFTDNGDGTATLAGTPATSSGGSYSITLTATNTAGFVNQTFTLTVQEGTAISSVDHATFTAGASGSFTVTTAGGFPTPPALSETGALPGGLSFVDNGDGTATLAGTATAGGVYTVTVTASNGVTPSATQSFTLTVNGPPSITSAATMTFTAGVTGTYTVTTLAGVPAAPITLTETGTLPAAVTFVDNGDGTATFTASAVASVVGSYPLAITASNGVNPNATQSFTLDIDAAAAVPLPPSAPTVAGSLTGVPTSLEPGASVQLSGSGFAAGAAITIGVYSTPVVIGHATADASGAFTVTVLAPTTAGTHTFIATGIGPNGAPLYLEAGTVVTATHASAGSGLPNTGLAANPRTAIEYGAVALVAGLMLLVTARRRRR